MDQVEVVSRRLEEEEGEQMEREDFRWVCQTHHTVRQSRTGIRVSPKISGIILYTNCKYIIGEGRGSVEGRGLVLWVKDGLIDGRVKRSS